MADTPCPSQILDTAMEPNDSGANTIRGYLISLLAELWATGEGFSGKRPFGNSGWEHDLYAALGKAGFIHYEEDEYGYSRNVDKRAGDRLIHAAIQAMMEADHE